MPHIVTFRQGDCGMEALRSWPAKVRAAHYQTEADKFRKLADAEPVERIRRQLQTVAEQYQGLATSLRQGQRSLV